MHIRIFATALTLTTLTTVVCRADDSKGVRKELDAGYARMCQGIKHKDVKPMAELSTPDFTMEEAGRTENAKAALAELEQSFKTMQPIDSAMTIRTLKISKDRAVATVDYSMSFTMKDAQGKTHQMSGKGVTEDTWIKTKSGWRIKKVKTLKADETMDGKTAKR